jgi:hypothetical protein
MEKDKFNVNKESDLFSTLIRHEDSDDEVEQVLFHQRLRKSSDLLEPEVKFYSVPDAIEAAGGFGRFQMLYVPLAGIGFIANGFFIYNLNYLTLLPRIMCPNPDGSGMRPWIDESKHRFDSFCTNGHLKESVEIDHSNYRSLTNWMSDMEMYCRPSFEVSLFGSIFFFGVLFCFIGLRMANKYGRRPVLIVGWVISLFWSIGLVFINNAIMRYVLLFIYGVWFFRNIQSYVLATELSPKRLQLLVWSSIFAFDLIEVVFLSVYFMTITRNYIYFFYFSVGAAAVMTIWSFFVPESPLFLYEKGRWDKAREIIQKMAVMNRSKLADENWLLDKEEVLAYAANDDPDHILSKDGHEVKDPIEKARYRSTLKVVGVGLLKFATSGDLSPPSTENPFSIMKKNPQILMNMIVLTMCWISISFNKYLIAFNLKHIEGNIFINAMLSPIADIIGHLLWVPVQKMTSTKITFMVSFALSFLFGAWLIFVKIGWVIPILIVFAKIGLASGYSLWYYMTSEYFPPLFLAFAFGVTQLAARAFTILAFPLSELHAPIPMILFSITPIIAFIFLFFVKSPAKPETFEQENMKVRIDEEMRNTIKLSIERENGSIYE